MGISLTIRNKKNELIYYGTKLYGYCIKTKTSKLESAQYLAKNKILDESDFFYITICPECVEPKKINGKQLKKFLHLYAKDLDKKLTCYNTTGDEFLNKLEIKNILNGSGNKIYYISWEWYCAQYNRKIYKEEK